MMKERDGVFPTGGEADRDGTAQPGEDKASSSLMNEHKQLKGGSEEDRDRLFLLFLRARARGEEHKLKHRKQFCSL